MFIIVELEKSRTRSVPRSLAPGSIAPPSCWLPCAQFRWVKENAEKRRLWEEDFSRRKEKERSRLAREEFAREKKLAGIRGCPTAAIPPISRGRGRICSRRS